MKHLKTFEDINVNKLVDPLDNYDLSVQVNDILNIARDEGLFVATPRIGRELGWGVTDETYYILRYTDEDDNYGNYENPIMSTQEFIPIIENIIQRLDQLDLLHKDVKPTYYRKSEIGSTFVGDKFEEPESNVIYATFTLIEQFNI